MDIGTILLLITLILLIIDVILLVVNNKIKNWLLYDNLVLYVATIMLFGAFIKFVLNLIFQDYSFSYVTNYSSQEMDIPLRIASSWSGSSGSFFLWTMLMFSGYIIFRYLFRSMLQEKIYQFASIIQGVNLFAFLSFTYIKGPFDLNEVIPITGRGLNPLLATFFNLIHPPIVFIGYSIFLIPFSIALAKIIIGLTDNDVPPELEKFSRFTMALAWLILGLGILIGGYWAYTTLGWGGFWAWDPVETGSLIPWLFALVYFHGSPVFRFVKGNYSKDIIATLPFLSVLFATIVTRTGLLQSVHAFGLSTSDYIIIVFLLGLVVVETFFIFKLYRKSEIKFFYSIDELKTIKRQDAALYISFFSFFLGTIAIMTGLIIPLFFALLPEPFNQSFIMDKKYFNIIIGIFGFGALEAAFFTDYVFIKTDKNKLALISIGVFLGIINAFLNLPIVIYELKKANIGLLYDLLHILGTTSLLANFMLPIIVMSLVILLITVYKFAKSTEIQKQVKMRKVSQTILHLGIIIALFGALVSYNSTQNNNVLLQPNGSGFIDVTQKTELKILDFQYEQDGLNFNRKLQAYVQVVDNGQVLGSGILHYTEYIDFGLIVNVLIISSVTSDYYLTIMTFTANENTQTVSDIRFQIRTIPMIGFLWLGSLIVLIAMVALVVISLKLFKFSYKKSQGMILSSKNILPANEISI